MKALSNFLKRVLPMPVKSLMREFSLLHTDIAKVRSGMAGAKREAATQMNESLQREAALAKRLSALEALCASLAASQEQSVQNTANIEAAVDTMRQELEQATSSLKTAVDITGVDAHLANSGIESLAAKLRALEAFATAVPADLKKHASATVKQAQTQNLKAVEPLGKIQETLKSLKSKSETLAGAVAGIQESVRPVASSLDGLDAKLATVEEKLDSTSYQIGATKDQLGAVDKKLGATKDQLGAVDSKLGAVDKKLGATKDQLGAVDKKLGALSEAQAREAVAQAKAIGELAAKIATTEARADAAAAKFDAANSKFNDATNKVISAVAPIKEFAAKSKTLANFAQEAAKHSREAFWAAIFNSTITKSSWMKKISLSPSGWAVGYQYLYVMYRVLNDKRPKCILDIGLGQSSLMIAQYAAANPDVEHIIVESSDEWIAAFSKTHRLPKNSKIVKLDYEMVEFPGALSPVRVYAGFKQALEGKVFDFVSIDAPWAGDMTEFARVDMIDFVKDGLAKSYVIMFDDTNRKPELATLAKLQEKLLECGFTASSAPYYGRNTCHVIVSDDNIFIKTM